MSRWSQGVDHLLELSVVGSFSVVGYDVRSRLDHWGPLPLSTDTSVLVTGATSGIGRAGALELARRGAFVIGVGRSPERARQLEMDLRSHHPRGEGRVLVSDMGDLEDVAALSDLLLRDHVPTVLLHNAGAITPNLTRTLQGIEGTLATQVVGPHLLTTRISSTWSTSNPGRVIAMTSGGLYTQPFNLSSLLEPPLPYSGVKTYARVKRAQVVWIEALSTLKGLTSAAVHPGWTATAGLRDALPRFSTLMTPLLRSASQGAADLVWLSSCPDMVTHPGALWLDRRRREPHRLARTRTDGPRDCSTLLSYLNETIAPYVTTN
ncbi:MAG: SDR family NAD(P)-dependent oxidoreductase [Acidimicrobiaceae bacterium]|nr:SDR family NAD(P)-dependent oxidoreductase [Acidimicrobiaceae bacterium]